MSPFGKSSLKKTEIMSLHFHFIQIKLNALLFCSNSGFSNATGGNRGEYKSVSLPAPLRHCVRERGCWTGGACSRLLKVWKGDGRAADEGGEAEGDSLNSTCSPREDAARLPSSAALQSGSPDARKCPPCMLSW